MDVIVQYRTKQKKGCDQSKKEMQGMDIINGKPVTEGSMLLNIVI